MNRFNFSVFFTAALLVILPARAQDLPDGPGKEVFNRVCTQCHGLDQVVELKQTKAEWSALVDTMVQYGAVAKDEEFDVIIDYLAKNFGKAAADKIKVNKATAKEIETGLALTTKEAEAIVQYRQKNGDFKNLQDLLKVTGVDGKKIDAVKDKIEF
jgi:competence ComEA-like helix-hairpin-helix protein